MKIICTQTIIQQEPTENDLKSIVLRLGGLHIQMRFLGGIGHLIAGSGLQELLKPIYADNAVGHILSRKPISSVNCAHFIVDAALNAMLMAQAFSIHLSQEQETRDEVTVND